jgi:hypothetical protein
MKKLYILKPWIKYGSFGYLKLLIFVAYLSFYKYEIKSDDL